MTNEANVVYAEEWKNELFKRDEDYKRSDLLHIFLPQQTVKLVMNVIIESIQFKSRITISSIIKIMFFFS